MADALIFDANIKFDKTGGVTDKDINNVLNRIQTLINKNELWVKLGIDPSSQVFLRNYGKSADELEKKLRLVAKSIQNLQKSGKYWDGNGMTAYAQRLHQTYHELNILRQTSSLKANEFEKMVIKNIKEEAKERERAAKAAEKHKLAVEKANRSLLKQDGYLQNLITRLGVYASLGAVGAFLTKIREVTAEFQLQQISLGAIIQDQQRANQLFEEIKTFALKSPVKILDLTKYTKQLAAYRIETDKLFDTTKRLADISVGLGVSMDRLVLFYGQVRATGYLRASEVRQATEAGIPLVEELAKKLSQVNGELVTAKDVMEMISKREISFQNVADVFEDMTSKGGVFYNMQEKQGNTLYGMWQKLGDAVAIMYDQIGNTTTVNNSMKMTISILRNLMLNWKQVGIVLGSVGALIAMNIIHNRNLRIATALATAENQKHILTLAQKVRLLELEQSRIKGAALGQRYYAAATLSAARAELAAATATNVFTRAFYSLKAAFLSNPFGIAIIALTTLIGLLSTTESEATKLTSKLQDINREYGTLANDSKNRFVELVEIATSSVDGSKRQKEALDELNRSYNSIFDSEYLEIDNLKKIKDNYDKATAAIQAYNEKRKGGERETAIKSSYERQISEAKDALTDYLRTYGASENQIANFFAKVDQDIIDGIDGVESIKKHLAELPLGVGHAFDNALKLWDLGALTDAWQTLFRIVDKGGKKIIFNYVYLQDEMNQRLDENKQKTDEAVAGLGSYLGVISDLETALGSLDWSSQDALNQSLKAYNEKHKDATLEIPIDITFNPGQFESAADNLMETANLQISTMFETLKKIAAEQGIEIPETFYQMAKSVAEGNKDFTWIDFDSIRKLSNNEEWGNIVTRIQGLYENLAPTDETIKVFNRRFNVLMDNFEVLPDKMQKYLMKSGDNLGEHRKKLSDEITDLLKEIARLEWTKKFLNMFGLPADAVESKIKETQETVKLLQAVIGEIPDIEGIGKNKSGTKSDTRLQELQEINQTLEKINKEYNEMLKLEGETQATQRLKKDFKDTLDYINKLGSKFGLKFDFPTQFTSLQQYRQEILKVMESLKNLKGGEKAILEFKTMISKADFDEAQKQIERKLKELQEKISASKTAREFYDKILSATGDVDIAANVTMSIYGDTGEGLFEQTIAQIREVFKSGVGGVDIPIDLAFDLGNQRIDYGKLAQLYEQYQNQIIEANRDTAQKIISEGQKTAAQNILNWEKELAKAKDYEQQRTDIIKQETERRANIYKSTLPQDVKDQLVQQSKEMQSRQLADLNFKEFKESEDYIRIFENLNNVSTATLERLRENLQKVIDTNKDLSPENMKQLVKALEDINDEIQGRGFGNVMIQSVKDYISALNELKLAKADLATTQSEYDEELPQLDADIEEARQAEIEAQNQLIEAQAILNGLKQSQLATEEQIISAQNQVVTAELRLNEASANVALAEEKKANAAQKVAKAEAKVNKAQDKQKKATTKFFQDMQMVAQSAGQLANILGDVKDLLEISADSAAGVAFDSAIEGLERFSQIMNTIIALQTLYNIVTESNPWIAIAAAVMAVASFLGSWISNEKVRKANKEIEKQQKLLDQLEYTYGRLQKAQEKLFGSNYIKNYNQQLANLEAQATAYRKQAEAEKSKGKKADKDKIKDYENSWRETMDEIKDMRDDLVSYFAGTDITSAARDFANSWLEARWAFEDTTEAMRERFADMVQNMIVESMAAQIMKNLLQPLYDEIDKATKDGNVTANEMANIAALAYESIGTMNNAMETMLAQLQAAGLDLSQMFGDGTTDLTGISRDIATASEESINGLAQGINTQNYYISHVPTISENVAAIRILMEGGAVATTGGGLVGMQNEHLAQLPIIAANTLATAERCERAAIACEAMQSAIEKVVVFKGNNYVLKTQLN